MDKPEFTCSVQTQFLPEQSQLPDGPYGFAYTISIHNSGSVTGQLIGRHWIITDATGHTEEVRGLAVVGHQRVYVESQPGGVAGRRGDGARY